MKSKGFLARLLGLDIGGTKVAAALGDSAGHVLGSLRRPTEPCGRPEDDVARLADDLRRVLADAGVRAPEVDALGISAPGPLDPESGVVLGPPNLPGWVDVPVRRLLEEALGIPAHLESDANAGALAEWRFGAGRGFDHVVFLTMSTGVGAGLVLGGRLHRGRAAMAGEVGHVAVEPGGERCPCGLRGCLEAYVGGAAWTRRLREVAPATSAVVGLAGGRESVTPEHVVNAAGQGDAFAVAEVARFVEYLARGLAQLAQTLAPDVIVLGTIAAAAGETLCFEPLRARVAERVWPAVARGLRIVPAGLGERGAELAGICAAMEGIARRGD